MRPRSLALAAALAVPALAVTGCAAQDTADPAGNAITVNATDTACEVSRTTTPAGQVEFTVTNAGSKVNEFYIYAENDRIVGEVENISPGLTRTFHVDLSDPGTYQTACKPGMVGDGIRADFTVTGSAAAAPTSTDATLATAVTEYQEYVSGQADDFLERTTEFVGLVKAGKVAEAKALYPTARSHWERIEPVAESFPDLDPAIDLRIGDVEAGATWTGFHPIEQALFEKQSTDGLAPLADQLVQDILSLQAQAKALSAATVAGAAGGYQPFEIANGSATLLDEVLASKITGEEEAYSRIDLLDFQANVEGSLQAFATLEPALDQIDPTLVPQISAEFDALTAALDAYRDPTALGGWTPYDQLTAADKKTTLTDALLAVQEPLSAISAKITN